MVAATTAAAPAAAAASAGALQLKELVFPDIVVAGILNALVQDKSTGKVRTRQMHPVLSYASDRRD